METKELIEMGRRWIEHAPEAKPGAPGLVGFTGPVGFVCSACAGRIIGRGCALRELATVPVWQETGEASTCALCGKDSP